MKPVIGMVIACNPKVIADKYVINAPYIRAIEACGGIPLLLPAGSEGEAEIYADRIDGLLLPGGEDVSPLRFAEDPIPKVAYVNEDRDSLELALLRLAVQRRIPVFGICRGMQLMNVCLGGTLYQDIPTQIPGCIEHTQDRSIRAQPTHRVWIEERSLLRTLLGEEVIRVNSYHHQAVKVLADGLRISAKASDGVVEAIESDSGTLYAVQWHPEEMISRDPCAKKLFGRLIQLAEQRRRRG